MDNYAAHKRIEIRDRLAANSRIHVHFTPTSGSWLNLVEVWFNVIEKQATHRGTFTSIKDLNAKIRACHCGSRPGESSIGAVTTPGHSGPRASRESRVAPARCPRTPGCRGRRSGAGWGRGGDAAGPARRRRRGLGWQRRPRRSPLTRPVRRRCRSPGPRWWSATPRSGAPRSASGSPRVARPRSSVSSSRGRWSSPASLARASIMRASVLRVVNSPDMNSRPRVRAPSARSRTSAASRPSITDEVDSDQPRPDVVDSRRAK